MAVTVRARMSSHSGWAQSIKDAAEPVVREIADGIANSALDHVRSITSSRFGSQGKDAVRLRDSFMTEVSTSGRSLFTITLTTIPGANNGKVGALNFGSKKYKITATKPHNLLANRDEGFLAAGSVIHSGHHGARFMEEARDLAVREATGIRRR
jgi:hypothetical protein